MFFKSLSAGLVCLKVTYASVDVQKFNSEWQHAAWEFKIRNLAHHCFIHIFKETAEDRLMWL